jgi:hypothetical protein
MLNGQQRNILEVFDNRVDTAVAGIRRSKASGGR